MRIPKSIIEEIKFRNNLEEIVSSYVTLKRSGSNLTGLCPFHTEKSPSFTLFLSGEPHFFCFGCEAGGDVITFIMHAENLDYISAVEFLARRAGITIPEDGKEERGVRRSRVLSMNRDAAKFFHTELNKSNTAFEYLTARGITEQLIRRFGLGYASDSFGALTSHMTSLGYTPEELTVGFLCGISKKTNRPYDYFRGRIIFPIIDVTGDVVAFGGRVIDSSMPKYLNTSDTPAFKKSKNLFALNFAKDVCSEYIILCEGYMDVIALHGAGFASAVATLGTALTAEQARIMKRHTKKVIISYDSDTAGQRASDKAFKLLGQAGLDTKILNLSDAKDPDEYIKKFGRVKFKLLLEDSKSEFEFKLESAMSKYDIATTDGKVKALNEIGQVIAGFYSAAERDVYTARAAKELGVTIESLKSDVDKRMKKQSWERKREQSRTIIRKAGGYGDFINPETTQNLRAAKAEEGVLGIMLARPDLIRRIKDGAIDIGPDDFATSFNRRVFEFLLAQSNEDSDISSTLDGNEFNVEEMGRITKMRVSRERLTDNGEGVLREITEVLKREAEKKNAGIEDIIRARRDGK